MDDSKYLKPAGDPKMKDPWETFGRGYSKKRYDKLVRDKIPEIIRGNGGLPKGRFAVNDKEYWERLKDKLQEEVGEFIKAKSREEQEEELADILEVLDAMFGLLGLTKRYMVNLQKKKAREKGRFRKRVILEEA